MENDKIKLDKFKLLAKQKLKEVRLSKKVIDAKRKKTANMVTHFSRVGIGRRIIIKWLKMELSKDQSDYVYLPEKTIREIIRFEKSIEHKTIIESNRIVVLTHALIDLTELIIPHAFDDIDLIFSVDDDNFGNITQKIIDFSSEKITCSIQQQEKSLKNLLIEALRKRASRILIMYNEGTSIVLPREAELSIIYIVGDIVIVNIEFSYDD